MRIERIDWLGFAVPFKRPLRTASTTLDTRYGVLLQLTSREGAVGWGEAIADNEGDTARLASLLEAVSPALLADDWGLPSPPDSAAGPMSQLPPALRFAIETALLDLSGKEKGEPAARLLGGAPRAVPVNWLIASPDIEGAVGEAREAVSAGFATLKLKIGTRQIEDDIALVRAIRNEVGEKVALRADANQAWPVEQAVQALRLLERMDLEYVEQPVAAGDIEGLRKVRASSSTPVAADEAVTGRDAALALIGCGAADFLVLKPARLGLAQSVAIAGLARESGIEPVVTSSIEAGVGLAACVHLAAAIQPSRACGLATARLLQHTLVKEPLDPVAGAMPCPAAPGLGVTVDMEAVRGYGLGISGTATQ